MKNLIIFFLAGFGMSSCTPNPDDMAKEYCACRADIDAGKRSEKDCAELAEKHTLKMEDEQQYLKTYAAAVLDCISDEKINPKK